MARDHGKPAIREIYRRVNARLAAGRAAHLSQGPEGAAYSDEARPGSRSLRPPVAAVYAGAGASHSWLWFADLLEDFGCTRAFFVDEEDVAAGALSAADAFLVSGGETFALARGLGLAGREAVVSLLARGGLYWGACAGACMMMRSTREPLGLFDLVRVKIANLVEDLPPQARPSVKFSSPYGCAHVFHPVRNEVRLALPGREITAPLFGGPPMEPSGDVEPLARYAGFTERTEFLAHPDVAERTLLGKVAVCRKAGGPGLLVLSGPHLEHPGFPEANALVADALFSGLPELPPPAPRPGPFAHDPAALTDFKREVSNIRITARGLCAHADAHWKVGRKYYEPEKAAVYAEAMWKRVLKLEKEKKSTGCTGCTDGRDPGRCVEPGPLRRAVESARKATEAIRDLKQRTDEGLPADEAAMETFSLLRDAARHFLNHYFGQGVS